MVTTKYTSTSATKPPTGPKRAGRLQLQNVSIGQRSKQNQLRRLILEKYNIKQRAKASRMRTNQTEAVRCGTKVTLMPQKLRELPISGGAIPSDDEISKLSDDEYSKLDVIDQTNAARKIHGTKQRRSVRNSSSRPPSSNKLRDQTRTTKERAKAVGRHTASSTVVSAILSDDEISKLTHDEYSKLDDINRKRKYSERTRNLSTSHRPTRHGSHRRRRVASILSRYLRACGNTLNDWFDSIIESSPFGPCFYL
jgi:hypothetical protein